MIQIFPDKASHDAAVKSSTESSLVLIENDNLVVADGVNVRTYLPCPGDIVLQGEDDKLIYIQRSSFRKAMIPAAWEIIGVLGLRRGRKGLIIHITNASRKWSDVYDYVVTGYVLDGESHTVQIRLHAKPSTATYFDFTYTVGTVEEFVAAFSAFLAENAPDFSCYLDDQDRVILQYNNYTSAEYYSSAKTYVGSGGLVLTSNVGVELEANSSVYMDNGKSTYLARMNPGKSLEYFRKDNSSTSYNPATDVTSIPSLPVCLPAYLGTSQYQSDHCAYLRGLYGEGEEGWLRYMEGYKLTWPGAHGALQERFRDGKRNTYALAPVTYKATDGTTKYKHPFARYCAEIGYAAEGVREGDWFCLSLWEMEPIWSTLTYGLSGVTRANSDPINQGLSLAGGSAISVSRHAWSSVRYNANGAWYYNGGGGCTGGDNFCFGFLVVPCAWVELPEGN